MARTRRATTTDVTAPAILAWEDDPGEPPVLRNPIGRPEPKLTAGSLSVAIKGAKPAVAKYPPGTPEFRYWTAADALGRGIDYWNGLLGGTKWEPSNGATLRIALDEGAQFNAFYDRNGLHFFHGATQGTTVYSGESPDVVCHELGHAVLDAVRPQLWDTLSGEVAAFHEAFGDISAILISLRLPQFATRVLTETGGSLGCTSRLSRLAEQLGWAIRQCKPDATSPDCLRNAANSFFYIPPETLPPQAPAAQLSSEPHSLSRVFTAAFLDAVAGMLRLQPDQNEVGLATVATDAGTLLIESIKTSPIVPTYFSQIAAHMIQADHDRNRGKYLRALGNGFLRHGILSLRNTAAPPPPAEAPALGMAGADAAEDVELTPIALQGAQFGLDDDLMGFAASQPKRFAVAGAAPETGEVDPVDQDRAATGFLEDLVRRGRIDLGEHAAEAVRAPTTQKTHEVVRVRRQLVVRRRFFDCGFDCACG